jgi:hypothetical protein
MAVVRIAPRARFRNCDEERKVERIFIAMLECRDVVKLDSELRAAWPPGSAGFFRKRNQAETTAGRPDSERAVAE